MKTSKLFIILICTLVLSCTKEKPLDLPQKVSTNPPNTTQNPTSTQNEPNKQQLVGEWIEQRPTAGRSKVVFRFWNTGIATSIVGSMEIIYETDEKRRNFYYIHGFPKDSIALNDPLADMAGLIIHPFKIIDDNTFEMSTHLYPPLFETVTFVRNGVLEQSVEVPTNLPTTTQQQINQQLIGAWIGQSSTGSVIIESKFIFHSFPESLGAGKMQMEVINTGVNYRTQTQLYTNITWVVAGFPKDSIALYHPLADMKDYLKIYFKVVDDNTLNIGYRNDRTEVYEIMTFKRE